MKRPTVPILIPFLVLLALAAGCASSDRSPSPATAPVLSQAAVRPPDWSVTSLTVGELLAKGGRQLSGAQVKGLFDGAVMEGVDGGTVWREMSFPDGKVTGQTRMSADNSIDYQGTWWVDEQGRRCWVNERFAGYAPNCMYYYLLDGRYYVSEADPSRKNADLEVRRISKSTGAAR